MFTPQSQQQKGRTGWLFSGRSGGDVPRAEGGSVPDKGKARDDGVSPPPQEFLGERRVEAGESVDAWRNFKEAGFLDESSMQRREKEALSFRIADLEKELHDYQYNMGLLLIEKKDWASKFEELRRALEESEVIIKREQSANLIVISDLEKREENVRKALGIEKQCVADLEKALHDIRSEVAEMKFTSDKKLAEACALEANLEGKYLDIQQKMHSADAGLAEASRRSSEAERKLQDSCDRERRLERDRQSLTTERKIHEEDLTLQRKHLREWEKNLQEGQKRLLEGQDSLNEREQRANVSEKELRSKEKELGDAHKKHELSIKSLKEKEVDISRRMGALSAKEQEVQTKMKELEDQGKHLHELKEKLTTREKVEIEKLLDDHKRTLALKNQSFESEMEEKRNSIDKELKGKLNEMEKNIYDCKLKEEKILIRERALNEKFERLKEKEKATDAKLMSLKDKSINLEAESKKIDSEKRQLVDDHKKLEDDKSKLENLKAALEAKERQIVEQENNLKVTEEERKLHRAMQIQLKEEIEKYRLMRESAAKESDDLRVEREKFEAEWEVLDERSKALEIDLEQLNNEKKSLETWRNGEEERLKNEKEKSRIGMERELEVLRLKKESFEDQIALERADVQDILKKERADIARTFDIQKHDLLIDMQKREEVMEMRYKEKVDEFNKNKDIELGNFKSSYDLNELRAKKLKEESERLEKQNMEILASRKKLDADQIELQKDIDTLHSLSRNLKSQRQGLIQERDNLLSMIERLKRCSNCGIPIAGVEVLDVGSLHEIKGAENVLPRLTDGFADEQSKGRRKEQSSPALGSQKLASGTLSWVRKCSQLFNFSPEKKANSPNGQTEKAVIFSERSDREASENETEYELEASLDAAVVSFDTEQAQPAGFEENQLSDRADKAEDEQEPSFDVAGNSDDVQREVFDDRDNNRVPSATEQNENEESLLPPESDSQHQEPKGKRQNGRNNRANKGIRRTRTMQATFNDAKKILGETSQDNQEEENVGKHDESAEELNIREESLGDSVHLGKATKVAGQRKRTASELPANVLVTENSDTLSESVSVGGNKKRRRGNKERPLGQTRYNLRRCTVASSTTEAAGGASEKSKGHKDSGEVPQEVSTQPAPSAGEIHEMPLGKSDPKTTERYHITSVDNFVRSVEISLQSAEDGEEVEGTDKETEPPEEEVEGTDKETEPPAEEVEGTDKETEPPATPSIRSYVSEDEDAYDEDEVDEMKQNSSIGKKLWTFFTT